MELKKSKDANIERLRLPIVLMSLLFVGSLVLASFSYTEAQAKQDRANRDQAVSEINYEQQEVKQDEPEVTPPPQVDVPPPIVEEIKEKENEEEPPPPAIETPPPPAPTGPVDQPKVEAEIIDFPDVEAGFPGGAAAMQKWINDNVEYPQTSIEMGDQGRVYLSFVVEVDGSISQIKVERGVTSELDREAKRVVRKMPTWKPGEAGGKKVRTRCRLPISFTLE